MGAPRGGPWKVEDASEAFQVLMRWMENRQANINPMAVKHFIKFKGSALEDTGLGQDYLCGLALGFFRHRLAGSCFAWNPPDPVYANLPDLNLPPGQLSREEVARAVIG